MIINLCGNICINIGTNSVKFDHQKSKLAHHDSSLGSNNSSVLSSSEQLDGTPNVPLSSVSQIYVNISLYRGELDSGNYPNWHSELTVFFFSHPPSPPFSLQSSSLSSCLRRCFSPCAGCWYRFLRHGRWWYIGWSVFTVGNVANFISLSFTPQSLLAGLGSSQFLMNAICEWYFNGHHITARMIKATILVIIGNTLIVAFASHQSPKVTVDELLSE